MFRFTRHGALLALPVTAAITVSALGAQDKPPRIPLAPGVVYVSTLRFPDGDRESLATVERVSPEGVSYVWRFLQTHADGDTIRREIPVEVSAADLATAPRWVDYQEPGVRPGYTTFSLSSAVYGRLASTGTSTFQIRSFAPNTDAATKLADLRTGGAGAQIVVWRGALTRVSAASEPFPLLMNGRRVRVPALHARGELTYRGSAPWKLDFWVLADSALPLLLKVTTGEVVLQTTQVNTRETGGLELVERDLGSGCRAELPGIYFAFNSAALDPASDGTIVSVAAMLARHPSWNATIEGHTDSIGSAASNNALSARRAEAVRERLVKPHGVGASRLTAAGFGASRPREPNATIEGRARNRRVELVRPCGGQEK